MLWPDKRSGLPRRAHGMSDEEVKEIAHWLGTEDVLLREKQIREMVDRFMEAWQTYRDGSGKDAMPWEAALLTSPTTMCCFGDLQPLPAPVRYLRVSVTLPVWLYPEEARYIAEKAIREQVPE